MKRIYNQNDVERVSAEVLIAYLRKIGKGDVVPEYVDIYDFVTNYLKCDIVIEDIYQSSDCLGYLSYGIKPLSVYRNGKVCDVIFRQFKLIIFPKPDVTVHRGRVNIVNPILSLNVRNIRSQCRKYHHLLGQKRCNNKC